jgi:hypothetical protein
MALTVVTMDAMLKNIYLELLPNALNVGSNAFYGLIEHSNRYVTGKKIIKAAPAGINGGIGNAAEDATLPGTGQKTVVNFESDTKNLFAILEISDKSIRASRDNSGAFTDLLQFGIDSMVEAGKYNYSRQLFTDNSGVLAITAATTNSTTVVVDNVKYFVKGLIIDILASDGSQKNPAINKVTVVDVDRANNALILDTPVTTLATDIITVQGSYGLELTGLKDIFNTSGDSLYTVPRANNRWLNPHVVTLSNGDNSIDDIKIQSVIDEIEEYNDGKVDYLSVSRDVRRAYEAYQQSYKRNVNTLELDGGFKAISFNGVPMVADKHAPNGTMDMLNSQDFEMHYMCDWEWLTDDNNGGRILERIPGKAVYQAVLAKYADLMCNKPGAQGRLQNIAAA